MIRAMGKIIEYIAVDSSSALELTKQVNKLIKEGYEPLGGISAVAPNNHGDPGDTFCQALVKRE